jgi:hypothetical protein
LAKRLINFGTQFNRAALGASHQDGKKFVASFGNFDPNVGPRGLPFYLKIAG